MSSYEKKSYFQERSGPQIKKLKKIEAANIEELIDAHFHSEADEYVMVMNPMFSQKYTSRNFSKYGPITKLRSFNSVSKCLDQKIHVSKLLKEAVDTMQRPTLGYSITPPPMEKDDLRPYVISWLEIFEGARVFAYANNEAGSKIELRVYGDKKTYGGANLDGSIPSRRKKVGRHSISIYGAPATPNKKNLAANILALQFYIPLRMRPYGEDLRKRRYMQIKKSFPGLKDRRVLPGMWAEVALYLEYIKRDTQETRKLQARYKNMEQYIPPSLEFSPYPMVTQFAVDMYKKFRNNSLNFEAKKFRDAEISLAISELARQYKYNNVFDPNKKRDKRIADYDWKIHGFSK